MLELSIHAAIISKVNGNYWKLLTGDPGCELFDEPLPNCGKHPLPNPYPSVHLFKYVLSIMRHILCNITYKLHFANFF